MVDGARTWRVRERDLARTADDARQDAEQGWQRAREYAAAREEDLVKAVRNYLTVHNLVPHDARPDDAARFGRLYRAADALVVESQDRDIVVAHARARNDANARAACCLGTMRAS